MKEVQLKGFVLNINKVKDNDAYLQILTKDLGLISVFCRRILSPNNNFHALSNQFALVEIAASESNFGYTLLQGQVLQIFSSLNANLYKQVNLSSFIAMAKDVVADKDLALPIYELVAYLFYVIDCLNDDRANGIDKYLVLAKLRLLAIAGFAIDTEILRQSRDGLYFKIGLPFDGNLVSERQSNSSRQNGCYLSNEYNFSETAVKVVLAAQSLAIAKLFNLPIGVGELAELLPFVRDYVARCLDVDYDSTGMLAKINAVESLASKLYESRQKNTTAHDAN